MSKKLSTIELNKPTIKVSVRGLVEFILRYGDIDSKKRTAPENAMLLGAKIHRKIQAAAGLDYHAEVPLAYRYDCGAYDLLVEGRADGIIYRSLDEAYDPDLYNDSEIQFKPIEPLSAYELEYITDVTKTVTTRNVVIDEIKGVYRDITKLKEPELLHISQAKVYAAIFSEQNHLRSINVRMTYVNLETEKVRYFENEFAAVGLIDWFFDLLEKYRQWSDFSYNWKITRQLTLKELKFPFVYRDGQKELAEHVYRTIHHKKRLYIEAPTGVGKTISTVFPTLKALGEGKADKVFYLTAKTLTATAASDTFKLLRREQGIRFKTVQITAKEKMCPMEECVCTPDACPYAKGHYDRINEAIYDLLVSEDEYMRETILDYAGKHMVCPFEFCLDMSLFSDGVICDYNYLFDPNVYLRRFFSEGIRGEYVFLVDEAHNLLDRAREMYSAQIVKEDILKVKKIVGDYDKKLARVLEKANKAMLDLKRETDSVNVLKNIDDIIVILTRVQGRLEDFLDEEEAVKAIGEGHDEILDFYFELRHFLNMSDSLDESYVIYDYFKDNGEFILKLFCIHPANHLKNCMGRGVSSVLFSATILPMKYYMELLSNDDTDYAVYAKSSFDPGKRGVFIADNVSTKYTLRGPRQYERIAKYIVETVKCKSGNYMAFFPSYRFMEDVGEYVVSMLKNDSKMRVLMQSSDMKEIEREAFLREFTDDSTDDSLIGLCVMGGIFSEGIDLKEDALIGAIIVGTGLPQVCTERELMKDYFDRRDESGFDYSYRYPGMNKVLQSAGRVIRTVNDRGIVLLLDDRFLHGEYKKLFPYEWNNIKVGSGERLINQVSQFWEENK